MPVPLSELGRTPGAVVDRSFEQWDALRIAAGFIDKPFPPELESDAPRLLADEVVVLWTDYLTGTRIEFGNRSFEIQQCAPTTGTSLNGLFAINDYTWELTHSPAARWNSVILNIRFDDSTVGSPPPFPVNRKDGRTEFDVQSVENRTAVYVDPRC